jgi:hypothetical protein
MKRKLLTAGLGLKTAPAAVQADTIAPIALRYRL